MFLPEYLPDDIQDKIWYEVHKSYLKDVHVEINNVCRLCRKIICSNTIYSYFLNCEMSNVSVRTLHIYLDYKKGKRMDIPEDNVYIKMDLFFW